MTDFATLSPTDVETELDRLAMRYRAAGGVGVHLLNLLGGKAEGLLDRLPPKMRDGLDDATERAVTTAMGAAGGFGGLPTAFVELPATVTILLRAIQGVAADYGFDPASESVQFDCVRVLAAAGPLSSDDGSDLGFITLRLTLTGGTMQRLIAMVAPRLAAVLGQKLAAQTVPLLGALAGAGTNYAYTRYYQQIAHVHFGLRKLAIDADIPEADLVERLRQRMRPRLG